MLGHAPGRLELKSPGWVSSSRKTDRERDRERWPDRRGGSDSKSFRSLAEADGKSFSVDLLVCLFSLFCRFDGRLPAGECFFFFLVLFFLLKLRKHGVYSKSPLITSRLDALMHNYCQAIWLCTELKTACGSFTVRRGGIICTNNSFIANKPKKHCQQTAVLMKILILTHETLITCKWHRRAWIPYAAPRRACVVTLTSFWHLRTY